MIWGVSLLLIGLGLAAAIWPWRGRRVDTHPLCRRCGYDLFGHPQPPATCPECGSDLSEDRAVRVGHRRRRPAVLTTAGLAVLLGILGLWAGASDFDPTPYKPVWWLRSEAAYGNAARRGEALSELTARATAGDLSNAQLRTLADDALSFLERDRVRLKPGSPPELPYLGELLRTAQAQGLLMPTELEAWARAAVQPVLKADSKLRPIVQDSALGKAAIRLDFVTGIVPPLSTLMQVSVETLSLDGEALPIFFGEVNAIGYSGRGLPFEKTSGQPLEWTHPAARRLTVGEHVLEAQVRVEFWNRGDAAPYLAWTQTLSETFVVEPNPTPMLPRVRDAAALAWLRNGFKVRSITMDRKGWLRYPVTKGDPYFEDRWTFRSFERSYSAPSYKSPEAQAYYQRYTPTLNMYFRHDGREFHVKQVDLYHDTTDQRGERVQGYRLASSGTGTGPSHAEWPDTVTHVDVILRPQPVPADTEGMAGKGVLEGEVVFEDVPVVWSDD